MGWRSLPLRAALPLVLLVAGCGYTVGYRMPGGVRRVAVPTFRNDTFPLRREVEFDLTRAVRQELELRTDAVLVPTQQAQALLEGTILEFEERVLSEGPLDEVEESSVTVRVRIRLIRSDDGKVLVERLVSDDEAFSVRDGETLADARAVAISEIAARIVVAIEAW